LVPNEEKTKGNDEAYLKSELSFQEAIESFTVRTTVRVIDPLVGTHNISRAGFDNILERPEKVS
jgi:hypothetical protein